MSDPRVEVLKRLTIDYSAALKETKNLDIELAKIESRLNKLQAAGTRGFVVPPDIGVYKQVVQELRQMVTAGEQLDETQKKWVASLDKMTQVKMFDLSGWEAQARAAEQTIKRLQETQFKAEERLLARQKAREVALQKEIQAASVKVPQLQAEATLLLKNLETHNLQSSELFKQTVALKEQIDLLMQKKLAGQQLTQAEAQLVKHYTDQTKELKAQATTAMARHYRGRETFWERRFGWFVAGTTFYGTLQAIRDIKDNMADIEHGMMVIERVSSEAGADFKAMQDELLQMGVQFGQTWDIVSDVAQRWAQAGYNVKDTVELTRTSLLALNTAELDATKATTGLISIMTQWGLTAEQLLPALDKINITADRFAINSADLIEGLSRSSGAAKMLGVTMEEAIAILTTMREATGRTGREIGNALNSIFSFIQRPSAINVFEAEGIRVYADAARTQLRSVMDILADVAARWPSMSDAQKDALVRAAEAAGLYTEEIAEMTETTEQFTQAQQRDIAQAMAGVYRRNYLIALLQNWTKVNEVLLNMEDALGYSMRENERTMETYSQRVRQLRAAWERFSQLFASAGILDMLKEFAEVGTFTLEIFNKLPEPIQAAVGAAAMFATTLGLVNLALKTFSGTSLAQAIGGLTKAQIGFLSAGSQLGALSLLTNPFIAGGIFAGSALIYSAVKGQIEYNQQLQRTAEAYRLISEELSASQSDVERHNRAQEKMSELLQEIGLRYPHLIKEMDEHGRVLSINAELLARHNKEMGDALTPTDQLKAKYEALRQKLAELNAEYARLTTGEFQEAPRPWEYEGDIPPGDVLSPDVQLAIINAERARLGAEREAIEKELQTRGELGRESTAGVGISFDYERWRKDLEAVKNAYSDLDLALIDVRKNLQILDSEQRLISDSTQDEARMKELVAQKTALLARENEILASVNRKLEERLGRVRALQAEAAEAMSDASEEIREKAIDAYNQASSEIRSLTQEIANNTVTIRKNEIEIQLAGRSVSEYSKQVQEARKKAYQQSFNEARKFFRDEVELARMSRDQQIAFLRQLELQYGSVYEYRIEIQKDLKRIYEEGLREELRKAEEAYRRKIELIDEETQRRIEAIREQIEALDREQEIDRRAERTRRHEQKIADIQEQIRYHSLRTGIEHTRAIEDLNKQLLEENARYQFELSQDALEDQKRNLQKQIDNITEAAERKKKALEQMFQETQKKFDDAYISILASAALYDQSWYDKGLQWAQQLADGFKDGSVGVIDSVLDSLDIGGATASANRNAIKLRSERLLAAKRAWEEAYARGDVAGMEAAARLGQSIRAAGPTLDPNNEMSADELEEAIRNATFHQGGKTLKAGFALLDKGERVLSASLNSQLERFFRIGGSTTTIHIEKIAEFNNTQVNDIADIDLIVEKIGWKFKGEMRRRGVHPQGVLPW